MRVADMKYFLNEVERKASNSTCYHEFFKGEWDENACVFWSDDSLNIHDDFMISLGLDSLIHSIVDDYDPFGETKISKEQWEKIYARAEEIGGNLFEAICEVTPWAEANFGQYEVFTILGI